MPRFYCDYCDAYLTHDSPSVRKTHNGGRKHRDNVRNYYHNIRQEKVQKMVDTTAAMHLLIANNQAQFAQPQGSVVNINLPPPMVQSRYITPQVNVPPPVVFPGPPPPMTVRPGFPMPPPYGGYPGV